MTAPFDLAEVVTGSLEAEALEIAQSQQNIRYVASALKNRFKLPVFEAALDRVYSQLTARNVDDPGLQRPAEWFLDNYYMIRRVGRQVATDLPVGFVRRLPLLESGPHEGLPRIHGLTRQLVAKKGVELDRATLSRFIGTYQQITPLSIAELWALPPMLRASVLNSLLSFLDELGVPGSDSHLEDPTLDPSVGVERAIRELRVLEEIDWQVFFEEHSCVEAVLQTDPANVYALMDFNTCDDYRKAVEDLAWNTDVLEEDVALRAVALAKDAGDDTRRGHVGYYLVDEGRRILEAQLGFKPDTIERVRRLVTRLPTLAYLLPLVALSTAPLFVVGKYIATQPDWSSVSRLALALAVMVATVPTWSVSAVIVQWVFAKLLRPRRLPKLDFSKGVADDSRTLVVIPTLLGRAEDAESMLQQIELHYLSNPDPMLGFALLTDYLDAKEMQEDGELLKGLADGISRLNAKHGNGEPGPFLLLHRDSVWNEAEGQFMGWERKRGKLEELNRLLRGDTDTTFTRPVGDLARLQNVRFVITLDSDTELPLGAARRLIGLLAHPLNCATFDKTTGRVLAGYTVVQPRVDTSPTSTILTRFAQIFSGVTGLDIYTHASSELYQDLFGAGIYCGKGIYDVDAFARSVDGRVPENSLASHDLFEGVHGRTALASDIILYEHYPSHYATYSRRMHRWVRGDWQLWPWLLTHVPSTGKTPVRNQLAAVDRWKIIDNLRRSLVGPCLVILLVAGWTVLPLHPLLATLLALGALLAPILPALANPQTRSRDLARGALTIVFVLHEAIVVVDAIARVFVRTVITHKNLLQWTSAANSAAGFSSRSLRGALWLEMFRAPVMAIGIAVLVGWLRPTSLLFAAPVLLAWVLSPEVARWLSKPLPPRNAPLDATGEHILRLLARRTWLFFETFVGPGDQWLPIDNYQAPPREQTAHRTSPTNIGLMMISTLSAYDLGYIGPSELVLRLRRSFDTIKRLTHYRGHLLNWYDTRNLAPLLPRYVSTVDSGNLAGCLLALKAGCHDAAQRHVIPAQAWLGIGDSFALVEDSLQSLDARVDTSKTTAEKQAVRVVLARIRANIEGNQDTSMDAAYQTLLTLCNDVVADLNPAVLLLLQTGVYRHEADLLHSLRTAMKCLEQDLNQWRSEVDSLTPWLSLAGEPAGQGLDVSLHLRLDEVPRAAKQLGVELDAWETAQKRLGPISAELFESLTQMRDAFERGGKHAEALVAELEDLANEAHREAYGMDFGLLFDVDRKLFHIGHHVTTDQVDPHYYDLLASEARLASFFAIIKGDVPESHWYALGRPTTRVGSGVALQSWGGTMFEYLMPSLLMRSREGTLIQKSVDSAVQAQIAYGLANKVPWGISESGYARRDAHDTYQYLSFGVPGLGFKRDLEADLVVAPYASLLAISVRPKAVIDNIIKLKSMGLGGTYGLFEAIDFRPTSATEDDESHVVRSYMAHHQGMLLVALDNYLNAQIMVDRFHAEPSVRAWELLLNERAPATVPVDSPIVAVREHHDAHAEAVVLPASTPWLSEGQGKPQAFAIGNGRLSTIVTNRGGGGLRWKGLALTRFQPDSTRDGDGIWFYVHEEGRGNTWLATSAQGRTTYSAHKAEFHQRDHGISAHVAITIAPADDVELRRITLHNESDSPRRLSLTSAGEPVLLDFAAAATHPAFARMFVESEYIAELDALVFTRRPRSESEGRVVMVHRLVWEGHAVEFGGYQTDRSEFFGRCRGARAPIWFADNSTPAEGRVGTVIDPVMVLSARVNLGPRESVTFAFVTAVASSRSAAVAIAAQYGSMQAVRWAFQDAERKSPRRLARDGVHPDVLPTIQRLFSALLFVEPTFRAPTADSAGEAMPRKTALWAHGISGDLPIVVMQVRDPGALLIHEVVSAQRYLRGCEAAFDLVIIDDEPSGYITDGPGTLRHTISQMAMVEWINKRGGIHLLSIDQLAEAECHRLMATARVVLDTRDGSLAHQMSRQIQRPTGLPRLDPTHVPQTVVLPAPVRPALLFDNGTGGFSEDGLEYIISVRPNQPTPAPWCNVLANPEFGCIVSESSLGSTWSLNAGENRLTPWRNDPVADTPSEVLYLRDEETAEVWSATPLPAGQDVVTTVHHGAGYTTYVRESHGLEQTLTIFVPENAPLKIARLSVKNTLPRNRRLTATYYVEWVLGGLREEQIAYIQSEHEPANACLLATCDWNAEFAGRVAFLAAELEVHGFTTDRTEFLGLSGNYALPDGLTAWGLSGSVENGCDPCGALQVHLELNAAGEVHDEIVTHFVLGQASSRSAAVELIAQFRQREIVDAAWNTMHTFWDEFLGGVRVKTPDASMDLMLNRWLLYQSLSSRIFGRTGFYQSSGAFGFRDQLQDVLAFMVVAPERARAQILEAAAHQFEEGDVLHWWHPPSGRGVRTRCSDDMAWLPYVTASYVAATGDRSILSERVTFMKGEPLADDEHDRYAEFPRTQHSEPLLEHCRRALHRALTSGTHGLPLMQGGDWNDGMNRVGQKGIGESVWLGWFLCATTNMFADLCQATDSATHEAEEWRDRVESLRAAIEASAWDGDWYVRAFHDDGSILGSKTAAECSIDSIAQSWAVLSGVGDHQRASVAMQAAQDNLVLEQERLILLLRPPFDITEHDPGYIRSYPPGVRENGGQYTHAAAWLGMAHAALGDGQRATRTFQLLNPILRTQNETDFERYRLEPYVLAGDIYSTAPWVGRGGWSWYTGSASWTYRLGIEAILGLYKEDGQLCIDPCIPAEWPGFEAWVRVGDSEIHIVVENPNAVSRGIASITLDGVRLESNRLDLNATSAHATYEVLVRLGNSDSQPTQAEPGETK